MAADGRAVDHVLPVVGKPQIDQRRQHRVPDALLGPAPEPDVDRVPLAIALVHVAPRAAYPQNVQHSVQEPPVVMRRPRLAAALRWKQRPDDRPFLVRHVASTQSHLQKGSLESEITPAGNPLCQQSLGLHTRELVVPSKDSNWRDLLKEADKPVTTENAGELSRLIYGDNLLAVAALLSGSDNQRSIRGRVDLIYIDPPFDSKMDYRTKINILGGDFHQKPTAIEQFAYSDTWHDGTKSYLESLVPLLYILKECLSPRGSIYIHLGKTVSNYVKVVADTVFGADNFHNEITWKRSHAHGDTGQGAKHYGRVTESIFLYSKGSPIWNPAYTAYTPEILARDYKYVDAETGEKYRLMPVDGPGGAAKGNPFYEFLGVKGYAINHPPMISMMRRTIRHVVPA